MSETPDQIIAHIPTRCTCGCSLEEVPVTGQTRRQVVDIPAIKPEYIEYRSQQKVCLEGAFQIVALSGLIIA
jgi:hypothetical protein